MLNKYLVQRLDHLGLVARMCKELGLEEYLNKKLPAVGKDKKLSYGTLVIGMILNGLGYVAQPLHMFPKYLKDKPLYRMKLCPRL